MPRTQIRAKEDYPMSTLSERQALTSDPMSNGGGGGSNSNTSPVSTQSAKSKKNEAGDDNDDNAPVQDEKVTTKWDLLVYYAKNSTMHGIPTIVGSELYRGRHIFWITVVCVMALFLGTVVYVQMNDYYNYPTVTSVDIDYVGEHDFPAITVCDLNIFSAELLRALVQDNFTLYHLTRLTEITGLYHRFGSRFYSKIPPPPQGDVSSEKHLQKLIDIAKGIKSDLYCSWGEYYWKKEKKCNNASSFRITEMGLCATINVRDLALDETKSENDTDEEKPHVGNAMRGLTLYFDVKTDDVPYRLYSFQGFKIILHEPDEEPLPLSSGFLVDGNTTVEAEISKTVKEGLPPPYKAFGSGTCVDAESGSFENPLQRFPKYTKEVCEEECFIDFVVKSCGGCRHFLHPGNESLCPVDHLADCYRQAQADYYGGHTGKNSAKKRCECPMPCKQSIYKASVTTSPFRMTKFYTDIQQQYNKPIRQTLAYVHFFYSDPVVSKMRQVAVHSTQGLLGTIGGHIGLFMGFSLVTVAEMLELIFLLVTRGRNLDEKVKRHKESEAAMQAALKAQALNSPSQV